MKTPSAARRWIRLAVCAALATLSIGALAPARAQAPERIEVRPIEITYRVTLPPPSPSDVSPLGRAAQVTPVIEGGVTTGFRISAVRPGAIWDRAGWREGDILRTVDGEVVDSPTRALELYERLKRAERVTVVLERDGQPLTLRYEIERTAAAPDADERRAMEPGPTRAAAAAVSGDAVSGDAVSGREPADFTWIRPAGEGAFTIQRSGLDGMLADPTQLARSARVIPAREGDAFVGFKIYGIRPASIASALGLRNGDLIRRVNGLEIATPQQALAAYTALRRAEQITVALTRGGAAATLRYTIVGDPKPSPPAGSP